MVLRCKEKGSLVWSSFSPSGENSVPGNIATPERIATWAKDVTESTGTRTQSDAPPRGVCHDHSGRCLVSKDVR
jgi:hypothetical protein